MTWLASYLWPYCRIAGMFMVMVAIGSRNMPLQIRLIYSVAVTIAVVPALAPPPDVLLFSFASFIIVAQQILIGVALGFMSLLVMQSFVLAGQIIGMQTSLGFASMVDPGSGQQVPVVGQFFLILATLIFFAVDGHLAMIKMLVLSFDTLPIGSSGLSQLTFDKISRWGGWMFTAALAMSMSAIVALLLINFSFGILTRASPQLNIFAIGFPVTMLAGITILWLTLGAVMEHFDGQWLRALSMMCEIIETRCEF